jgi:hypothetical protein
MGDPLTLTVALGNIALGLRVVDGLSNLAEKSQDATVSRTDVGRVYDTVRDFKVQRAILGSAQAFTTETRDIEPVESPVLNALRDLYVGRKNAGKVYVLYDKAGKGKTTACEALLRNYYCLSDQKEIFIQGFMVSAESFGNDMIMENLCNLLGGKSVDGWIHAMILAMDEPQEQFPSILILDGFNSAGKDEENMNFIKGLFATMNGKRNMFVVVVTQDSKIAFDLVQLNGGERVSPLEGCYTGDDKMNPVWKEEPWERELLIEAVHYDCPGKFGDGLISLDFVKAGMTPLQVVMAARSFIRPSLSARPGNPKKQKRDDCHSIR